MVFGAVVLVNASSGLSEQTFGNPNYYLKKQALFGAVAGLPLFFLALLLPYKFWKKIAFFALLGSIVLLIAVFFPPFGLTLKGASRWLLVWGGYTLQPSEFAKIALVLYLAAIFEKKGWQASSLKKGFLPFAVVVCAVAGLVALEPDLDTAIIIAATGVAIYFVAGAKISHFLALAGASVLIILLLIYLAPYRLERFKTFLNSENDSSGSGYHISQIQSVIISGGLTGDDSGSELGKYRLLPEPAGDSAFAVAAKEFGFIGASLIIMAFLLFSCRGIWISKTIPDVFGRLTMVGLSVLIGLQAFMNMSSMLGIMPLAGMPLPFISSGGTALIANMFSVGLMLNISKNRS